MFVNERIHIKLKSLLFFVIISCILYSQNYQKEILPLKQNKIGVVKFSFELFEKDTLFGIFHEFNARGEKIPGTSFLALSCENADLEYEILWRYDLPQKEAGDFTDFTFANIDSDQNKEIIITSSSKSPLLQPILFFELKGNQLHQENIILPPNLSEMGTLSFIQKSYDNQNAFYLLSDNFENDVFLLHFIKDKIDLQKIWHYNSDQIYFESLLLSNKSNNFLIRANSDKLQLLRLNSDSTKIRFQEISELNGNIWDIQNIDWADFNGDGEFELVIGRMNGGINLISALDDSSTTTEIFSSAFQYDRFFIFDIDRDKKEDLLIVDSDGRGVKSYSYGPQYETFWSSQLLINTDMTGIKFLNKSIKSDQIYFSYLFPEFMHHGIIKIFSDFQTITDIHPADEEENAHYDNIFSELDSTIATFSNIHGKPIKIQTPQRHEIIEIKSNRKLPPKADFILEPGQKFVQKVNLYSVSSENLNYTINAPEGMRFNLVDHSFIWQPSLSHLGLHKIDAVFFWDDVEVKKEFTIYINDPIEIINKLPSRNIIQAGEIFQYQLDIKDRNSENIVNYKMTEYPDGATINSEGLILWKPETHQKDWYDFKLTVSDGFSDDHLNFSIFVNHPLKIWDTKPINLTLGKNLNYKIKFDDNNAGYFLNQYNMPPKVENWEKSGVYETVILTNETKQKLPQIIKELNSDNTIIKGENFEIKEVFFEQNKLIMLFTFNGSDAPKFAEIFAKLFDYINIPIPNHTSYIATQFYKYTLKNSPEGTYITNDGIIKWKPELINLGKNEISFTVSDDYYSDEGKLEIFVNDLPKVVSTPTKYANINEEYTYQIQVEDRNKSEDFHFKLLESPENSTLSQTGKLQWLVDEDDEIDNYFKILVSDGRDTITHGFNVQINQKPSISSPQKVIAKTGRLFEYQVKATDPEEGNLYYRPVEIPNSANFDSNKGLLFWKPGQNMVGNYNIVVEVKDEEGNVAYDKFLLQVQQSKINFKTFSILTVSAGLATLLVLVLM